MLSALAALVITAVPQDMMQTDAAGVVAKNAAEAKPLPVGSTVPDAMLGTLDGKIVSLSDALGGKPTALVFYRGGWCPYCNRHLADLQKVKPDLAQLGYQLIAITPDRADGLKKMIDDHKLDFTLYSDPKADSLKKFGVAFRVDDDTYGAMKNQYQIDLESWSGEKHHILPVPSVFLINAKGVVTYVHSNPDYKVRLKGEELVKAAKEASEAGMTRVSR